VTVSSAALRLLDAIEKIEIQSLAWGFTDGSLSEDELFELAGKVADGGGGAEDLIEELLDARVMFEHRSGGSNERYRSRFAEMVRLLAASRQLFVGKPWQSAPRLVADFRVDRRPRRFPSRDRAPQAVLKDNAGVLGVTGLRQELWTALTSSRGGFLLTSFQERATARLLGPAADTGTIVTAGTGSGKTLAVYLPALIRIGESIGADHWVKVLAVYPRTELLKDQFAEAYRNARSIDAVLMAKRLSTCSIRRFSRNIFPSKISTFSRCRPSFHSSIGWRIERSALRRLGSGTY
jgi:DEAD/DEAH box helicase